MHHKHSAKLPIILNTNDLAQTRLFKIQEVELEFSNGELRVFERLQPSTRQAVIIAAVNERNEILLISEYAAGTERYELGLPKGLVDVGETIELAANRELQEEVGMKAQNIKHISSLLLAPNYMSHSSELLLATELLVSKLKGDEPEPIEVVPCHLNEIDNLVMSGKIKEARSIASLYIIKNYLSNHAI